MFDSDFKDYVVVIDRLNLMIEEQPDDLIQIVDVIFKWIYLKLDEISNTTFLMKVYDFLGVLFSFMLGRYYVLADVEAFVLVPMLCEKTGNNNTIVKNKIKALIKQCFDMYDPIKCLALIIDFGCSSKTLKSASESLDEVAAWITKDQMQSINEKQIKTIVKLVDHSDQGVRKGALKVLGQVYSIIEEDIWKMVGKVNSKVKDLMEKRFRQVKILKSSQKVSAEQSSAPRKVEQSEPPQTIEQATPQTSELSSGQQR